MSNYQYKTAVYIGRFQPIHNGHLKTVKRALEECQELIIFVGTSFRPRTVKNPFTFNERKEIIEKAIKDAHGEPQNPQWRADPIPESDQSILKRVKILPLRDYMYNDYKWVSEVQAKTMVNNGNSRDVQIYGCYKDDSSYYLEMFPKWSLEAMPPFSDSNGKIVNATSVRDQLFETRSIREDIIADSTVKWLKNWKSKSNENTQKLFEEYKFLEKYKSKWSEAPYQPTFVTVDSLVIKSGCILLVKRKLHPGKGLYALPGGFLDQNEPVVNGAVRELSEETNIRVPTQTLENSLETEKRFDHPSRDPRGRTITFAHLFDLGETGELPSVEASDDAAKVEWVPMAEFYQMEDQLFNDHYDIIYNLTANY